MHPKQLIILIGLILFLPFLSWPQNKANDKHEFIYKTVEGHEIKANIFLPASQGLHPVVVYFHGGGFIFGNRDHGLEMVLKEKLLAAGYSVVSADYRLAPETKLGEMLQDVGDVIKWLKQNGEKNYSLDINRIASMGGSSGGYLAYASAFNPETAPNAIVGISAPTGFSATNIQMGDLSVLDQPGPFDVVKDHPVSYGDYSSRMDLWRFLAFNRLALYEIFGFDPASEPEKLERFTLTANVKPGYPPTLIVQAKNDRLVDLQQAQAFYNFLQEKKVKSEIYLVENGHSSELINQYPEATDEIIRFLNHLFFP
jgi:acetyl esterase/lipase